MAIKNSNNVIATEFKVEVKAKDKDGKVLGHGRCFAYAASQGGIDKAVKRFTLKGVIGLLNRQIKTDARNDLAREKSVHTQAKKLESVNVDFAREIKALRQKYKIEK